MKTKFKGKIKGKVVLITGGTGSFGNAVVERLLDFEPRRIIIFSRDEKKQEDMRNRYNSPLLKFIIGDVRDKESVDRAMRRMRIDYVFHAAALKQVPTCEFFPIEAIKTNIFGACNVLEAAIANKVKKAVILSTDKAAYPINAMGMSKALMEKVMIALARGIDEDNDKKTVLCGTRYGNVLYTRGSVVPYFVSLLKQNKKLTVTNPKMTRFLLPLKVSVDLVLYALVYGKNGHMYVRKAPSCTIETLAKAICKIFSYKKGYKEVGVRAGEKMHETLITREEFLRTVDFEKYYEISPESQGLDYDRYYFRGKKLDLDKIESYTSANTERLNVKQTIEVLLKIPEIQQELKNLKS